ncbi:hypothetical protein BLNAU_4053 [Blattamonas nauphoetae]|uniref:Uncharacterized protein n=1 Tax=Blattamonas nauphoetae TaxID=2049346 RepID=A0ABQ9YBC3_9EUKA|nr:hypothetical protein BLNAU_4053 [Blattamonas nauphoetae]
MTYLFPQKSSRRRLPVSNSTYQLVINFAYSQNHQRARYADRIGSMIRKQTLSPGALFEIMFEFETDVVWYMLVTLVKRLTFNHNDQTRNHIQRTVKETLKQISSLYGPALLTTYSGTRRNDVLNRATIHLLDFMLIEMERLPSVKLFKYPLNMIDPFLPYMLLFVTSSDSTIQNKAASILHSVTSVPTSECIPAFRNVDTTALQADIDLWRPRVLTTAGINLAAASTLLGHLSTLFVDADVSDPCVRTVKLLIQLASSLLTSKKAIKNLGNCLPLTLLVTTLTAAPPSHYLPILNIFLESRKIYRLSKEIHQPFLKRLLAIFPPDTSSDDHVITGLLTLLSHLASHSSLWKTLVEYAVTSNPPTKIALSLLSRIWIDPQQISPLSVRRYDVPRIARLLFQELDELSLSFVLSVLGQCADLSTEERLEEDEAQRIVEKLLEIEQRHPLHTVTQDTNKTTTDGMTQSHIDRKRELVASTGKETNASVLVDVWRVMGMTVSSLARSPSGLERLHVLYPLIVLQMKERGNTLLRKDKRAEQTREMLLPALVRVCSELTPLLQTVDCFPLVQLVSSFLILIRLPANRRAKRHGHSVLNTLPDCYVRVKEFFLRVDEVTQGLDGYDITHHTIFPRSSTRHPSVGADCVISRPIPLLQFFVDFEVKCVGVKEAALLQQNNTTAPDRVRRQLLLHLLSALNRTNDFDPSAVCGVIKSFPRLPPGTTKLVNTLKDTLIVARNPSPPVCAKEICRLLTLFLMRAVPNEADSEERWRVVLREEGWEDLLNVILRKPLSKMCLKNGMNCTVASFIFKPSTVLSRPSPPDTLSTFPWHAPPTHPPPAVLWAEQAGRQEECWRQEWE